MHLTYREHFLAKSQVQDGNKLSRCLDTLKAELDTLEPNALYLEKESKHVVTYNEDWDYHGVIVSQAPVYMHQENTYVENADLKPENLTQQRPVYAAEGKEAEKYKNLHF